MTTWIVRCAVGGSIIGGKLVDDQGKPFRKATALREAWRQNCIYQHKAERENRATAYQFWADSFEKV